MRSSASQPTSLLADLLVGAGSAAQAEQPLGVEQVGHHRDVDDEGEDLQRRQPVGQLVDLERQQRRRDEEGQVLGPAALVPQADGLDALDRGVGEDDDGEQVQLRGLQREELVDLAEQAVMGVSAAGHGAALEVGDDAVEAVAEGRPMRGEEQDREAEEPEDEEVQRPG